jgi:hypothetical protein
LSSGELVEFEQGDVVHAEFDNRDYAFKLYELGESGVDIVVNNFLYVSLGEGEEKKLDLDGDSYLDIAVLLDSVSGGKARVSFSVLDGEHAGGNAGELLSVISRNQSIQLKFLVLIFLVFIVIGLLFVIKAYFLPYMNVKKFTSRETSHNAFVSLVREFHSVRKKDKRRAVRLGKRMRHMYGYLPVKEKRSFKSEIDSVNRFLVRNK